MQHTPRASVSLVFFLGLAGLAAACGGGSEDTSPGGSLSTRKDASPDVTEDGAAGSGGAAGSAGADGGGGTSGGGGTGGSVPGDAGTWPGAQSVCYLLSCTSDGECAGCTFGRNHCDTATSRCVACDPGTMTGCPANKTCTTYGTCVDTGASCPLGGNGVPTITCASDADCAACDPQHQACDTATKRCGACSTTNTSSCAPNEVCVAGGCAAKCPATCAADVDCARCDHGTAQAHACGTSTHVCAECSATTPCPTGKVCSAQGRCIAACGVQGEPKGSCLSDMDCAGCGNVAIACHQPVNGGLGKCGVPASGCSDLGQGVTALPPPWDAVTNTCSNDMDCANAGLALNVGKLLRDLTGVSQIGDATVQYEMNSCASVSILGKSCGVCVPCRTDADCKPIELDPLVSQMLGPLGLIAERFILDQVFGPGAPHQLNLYCEPVAGDYGVCAPCTDPTSACGVSSTTGSGCTSDWECAWGGICKESKCVAVKNDCTFDSDCPGQLCGWNGMGYCCQPSGAPKSSYCFADTDCTGGEVCIQASDGFFYCNVPQCK